MKKILINNVDVITMDEELKFIKSGHIVIEDNMIKSVGCGSFEESEDFYIIDGKNYLAMPGLINAHTHTPMTLIRGIGEGLPLMKWLNEVIWPTESKFNEKHIKLGAELATLEMIKGGTTAFNDMYFMLDEALDTFHRIGIRGVLGYAIIGDSYKAQIKKSLNLTESIKSTPNCILKTAIAPHAPYTLTKEQLIEISEVAKDTNSLVHIHVSETKDEVKTIKEKFNQTPTEYLNSLGMFKNKTIAAHCVHINEEDMKILKENDVTIAHNPQSNMKLASGVSPIKKALDLGINVALGTDGTCSNNNLNMFEEMCTASMLQKLYENDATCLSPYETLNLATVNGGKGLGYSNLGKIKEGALADLILLNKNNPSLTPMIDPISNIAFSANGSEVEYVIINGKMIMEKGELKTIDEEKILYESNKIISTLV